MIKFRQTGGFSNTEKFFNRVQRKTYFKNLEKYGREGVAALMSATPKDTGLTANSWDFTIEVDDTMTTITFENHNIQNGVPIAVILQYGHATRNGGWVEGIDYINPAIRPIFEKIADDAWKEVTQ